MFLCMYVGSSACLGMIVSIFTGLHEFLASSVANVPG